MQLTLFREQSTDKVTIGKLYVDGHFQCYTLEDPVRDVKIPHITAIPAGTYNVICNYSQRFKRMMPLLEDVPNYEGVRIHPGNKPEDTDGCLLVGRRLSPNSSEVLESRFAYGELLWRIQSALANKDKVTLTICNKEEECPKPI